MLENKPLLIGLAVGLLVIVVGGFAFFGSKDSAPVEPPRTVSLPIPEPEPTPPPPEPEPEPEPLPEPEPEPELDDLSRRRARRRRSGGFRGRQAVAGKDNGASEKE